MTNVLVIPTNGERNFVLTGKEAQERFNVSEGQLIDAIQNGSEIHGFYFDSPYTNTQADIKKAGRLLADIKHIVEIKAKTMGLLNAGQLKDIMQWKLSTVFYNIDKKGMPYILIDGKYMFNYNDIQEWYLDQEDM